MDKKVKTARIAIVVGFLVGLVLMWAVAGFQSAPIGAAAGMAAALFILKLKWQMEAK